MRPLYAAFSIFPTCSVKIQRLRSEALNRKVRKESRQGREAVRALRRPTASLLVSMSYAQDRSLIKMSPEYLQSNGKFPAGFAAGH